MGDLLRRWGGPGITTLVGVGFAVIPPVQSYTLAYIAWVMAALWAVYLAWPKLGGFWPGIKKRWPFALARTVKQLRTKLRETKGSKPRLQLSPQEIAERHIRYRADPIRLVDLLEVAGQDGAIMSFTFEHCKLEGPGIITFRGPPPDSERQRGMTAYPMVGPTNCTVEGAPKTTLYEIYPGGIKRLHGVIQLVGPTIRNVTFRNLGFAGTADELEWLREHLTFSEGVD